MYCSKCGTQNPDNATICSACGADLQNLNPAQPYSNPGQSYSNTNYSNNNMQFSGAPYQQPVKNNLVYAILVTLFCCLPLGIVAIITSTKVDDRLRMGDYNGAVEAANKTKTYCLIALGLGIAVYVIYFFIAVLSAL